MNPTAPPKPPVDQLFEAALRENGIPPCPSILQQITAELRRESPDLRAASSLIAADVGLSAGLLKMVNSPYFGLRRHVSSVLNVLTVLGLDTVSCAMACLVLERVFPTARSMERFWDTSTKIAQLASWLARDSRWSIVPADEAYTYGLFRDCGIAVMLQRFPGYVDVLGRANQNTDKSFTAIEEEVLPSNHALIGAMLTQSWWLPERISAAVRHHHSLAILGSPGETETEQPTGLRQLIALAQVAEYLQQVISGRSTSREWEKLGPACLEALGLSSEELAALEPGARELLAQNKAA